MFNDNNEDITVYDIFTHVLENNDMGLMINDYTSEYILRNKRVISNVKNIELLSFIKTIIVLTELHAYFKDNNIILSNTKLFDKKAIYINDIQERDYTNSLNNFNRPHNINILNKTANNLFHYRITDYVSFLKLLNVNAIFEIDDDVKSKLIDYDIYNISIIETIIFMSIINNSTLMYNGEVFMTKIEKEYIIFDYMDYKYNDANNIINNKYINSRLGGYDFITFHKLLGSINAVTDINIYMAPEIHEDYKYNKLFNQIYLLETYFNCLKAACIRDNIYLVYIYGVNILTRSKQIISHGTVVIDPNIYSFMNINDSISSFISKDDIYGNYSSDDIEEIVNIIAVANNIVIIIDEMTMYNCLDNNYFVDRSKNTMVLFEQIIKIYDLKYIFITLDNENNGFIFLYNKKYRTPPSMSSIEISESPHPELFQKTDSEIEDKNDSETEKH